MSSEQVDKKTNEGWFLYQKIAVIVLTAILIFILLNLVSLITIKIIKGKSSDKIIKTDFHIIYPRYSKDEIRTLWKETTLRSFQYDPYTQFRERPYQGKYVHIDAQSFRHNRNQASWPPQKDHYNIFFFGGSTGFGWGVSDEETIASHLQDLLASSNQPKVSIYNFSQGAFFSLQERAFFEQLILSGFQPDMAIFFDGLNECSVNEPLYTENLKLLFDGKTSPLFSQFPLFKIFKHFKKNRENKKRWESEEKNEMTKPIIQRYLSNKTMIEKIGKEYDIKTVFVWQPVPFYQYNLDLNPFIDEETKQDPRFYRSKNVYPRMETLFKDGQVGENFLWLADMQTNLNKPLYVDRIHYSDEMSSYIASKIYDFIEKETEKKTQTGDNSLESVKVS